LKEYRKNAKSKYIQKLRDVCCANGDTNRQGAIKYGRLAEFLPGKPDFNRKFGLLLKILANHHMKIQYT